MVFPVLRVSVKEAEDFCSSLFKALTIALTFVISGCTTQSTVTHEHSNAISNKQSKNQIEENKINRAELGDSKEKAEEPKASLETKLLQQSMKEPLSPENTSDLIDEVGSNWLYGQGMGETAATVGTIVVFPPYALWVIGNAALQLSGEEPIEVSKILPEESGKVWRTTYDEITSVPGRTTAAVSGEEYRTQEVARDHIEAVIDKNAEDLKKKKLLEQKHKLAIVESH